MQTDIQPNVSTASNCISTPTTSSTLPSTMALDESDEPPCQNESSFNNDLSLQREPKLEVEVNLDNTQQLQSSKLKLSPLSTTTKSDSIHDEQTLVMMITELDNEEAEETEKQQLLKRKSDMGILELDLPLNNKPISKSSPKSTSEKLDKVDELSVTIDEPMDTVSSLSPQGSSRQQSPNNLSEKEQKQQQDLEQSDQKSELDVKMDTEKATTSSPVQLSPIDTTNITSSSKQPSPMDISTQIPSPGKVPEICENSPPPQTLPPIMPRNANANVQPPPRPSKPKIKRRPPNLPSIQQDPADQQILSQSRLIETLRLRVEQIRNLQFSPISQLEPCNHITSNGKKSSACTGHPPLTSVLRLHIKIDGKEVFQSAPVPMNESCVFSDECFQTLPPNFHSIQLILVETVDGRITRQVGRKSLKRRDIIATAQQDIWLPIGLPLYSPLPNQPNLGQLPVCEVLGQLCLDIDFDEKTKELEFRVLDCTSWKRPGASHSNCQNSSSTSGNKRPQSQQLDYAPNPAVTSLHTQVCAQRSLPGSQAFALSGSTTSLSQRHPRELQVASPALAKKAAKFSLSPKISRKNRHSQPLSVQQQIHQQQKLTGSLSSGFERKRPPSLGSQPLPRPQSPTPLDFGTPGAPLFLTACVVVGQTQTPMRRMRIIERRGLEPVRIDCSAISNSVPTTSHDMIYGNLPATAPPHHQRITVPLTPTTTDSTLQPSLCIRVSSEPNFDESTCYGSLYIDLNPQTMLPLDKTTCGPNWYSLKSRSKQPITTGSIIPTTIAVQPAPSTSALPKPAELDLSSSNSSHNRQVGGNFFSTDPWKTGCSITGNSAGEMKVVWTYKMDHLLPPPHYQPLYKYLTNGLRDDCSNISLLTLIQQLPVNLEDIVPPLMKICLHANQQKQFFRLLCYDYMAHSNFHDANTLFRSQSMVSKSMYEMMKFVGQDYLACSLKPLINLIYSKRECCEIDPARLKPGDVLENNQRRLMVYVELAFSCVVESSDQCPMIMRDVFAELRSVVAKFFPQHEDNIGRLAVSSFLIMRFFSAAILNPKIFGLKRESPEPNVMRTLVLISKVLQRLANCVVSEKPLTTKEEWLAPILERVSDPAHKQSMIRFLDIVSNAGSPSASTPPSPVSSASPPPIEDMDSSRPSTLKFGHMIERRSGSDKKRSFKNLIHQKKRYVTLTENELTWQKVKEGNDDLEPKGNIAVADIHTVALLPEYKHSFCVSALNSEVHFQANNTLEMNEWMILIEKQKLIHTMFAGRSRNCHHAHKLKIDLEKELETIYSLLERNLDTLCAWKQALEKGAAINFGGKDSPTSLDKLIHNTKCAEEQEEMLKALEATVCRAIFLTQQISKAHKNRGQALKLIQTNNLKSQPTTPGSPLSSPTALLARSMDFQARFNAADSTPTTPTSPIAQEIPQKDAVNVVLVDSENYLHLRSSGACKRVRKAPNTNLYDSSNKLSASNTSLGPPPKSPTA